MPYLNEHGAGHLDNCSFLFSSYRFNQDMSLVQWVALLTEGSSLSISILTVSPLVVPGVPVSCRTNESLP